VLHKEAGPLGIIVRGTVGAVQNATKSGISGSQQFPGLSGNLDINGSNGIGYAVRTVLCCGAVYSAEYNLRYSSPYDYTSCYSVDGGERRLEIRIKRYRGGSKW
jgi:hypothetical protein